MKARANELRKKASELEQASSGNITLPPKEAWEAVRSGLAETDELLRIYHELHGLYESLEEFSGRFPEVAKAIFNARAETAKAVVDSGRIGELAG
jgi:hypothetical protein